MRVRVYRNLHRKCYSVVDTRTGRVVAHRGTVQLEGVTFTVRPAGRQKVLETGRKNVHAFAVGTWVDTPLVDLGSVPDRVAYNPYRAPRFYMPEAICAPYVEAADRAILHAGGVNVANPKGGE